MSLEDVIADIATQFEATQRLIGWAEDEIRAAQARHPEAAQRIWRSFQLLAPALPLPWTETVYRAHCHELLERAARAGDTRPGTAAECCLVLSQISLQAPLRASAAGLYARMWRRAGLPADVLDASSADYEALYGQAIDDGERDLRAKLRQSWRIAPGPAAPFSQRPAPSSGR
ncbi:hypothetical protein OWR29_39015 [Actinoplanes sp. Pm04-4]|uniref:Uncharacterized protein n=1 Tax=Paractinoplanes pyxinae TaxID=2997416 RepID=A0ABT4BBX5_9ACTN|nr:hypothetical protein [Actinoplanes pyxinae]MCY1144022.1 hypothetical protein [Actinoplanes pyxinae]